MLFAPENVGGASLTVTVKLTGAAPLPAASWAVQLTVVVPIGNVEPELSPAVGDEVQVRVICAVVSSGSDAVTL
jgi:hypothetical protein